jgi:hypothetical protein
MIDKLNQPRLCNACAEEVAKEINNSKRDASIAFAMCEHTGTVSLLHHCVRDGRRVISAIEAHGPALSIAEMEQILEHAKAALAVALTSRPTISDERQFN